MNHRRFRFLLPVVALMAAGSLVGCTEDVPSLNNPDRMKIAPLVALNTSGVEAGSSYGSSAQTKAPVSGSEVLDLYVARADQTSASAYGAYDATTITATRAAGTGQQSLTLDPVQYYRADGLKTKLTGWYPTGTYNGTNHTVSWTIDGQQDIMTAPKQEGSWTSAMPTMTFDHRLTQLQFYPYAETQEIIDAWGKITGIEVLNQQNTVVYALTDDATGTVSFSGATTNSFSAGIAAGGASLSLSTAANKVTNAKQMGNSVMIVPQSAASHTLTLRIILADNTYKNVTLTGALTAGTPYRLYMKFTERDITIETTVTQWNDVTTSDNMGNVRIGDYLEGGIVYWVDPNDVGNYKVVSLEENKIQWAASDAYAVSGARSDADGRANSKAIRDYFEANPSTVGTDFAVAFPAASYCYNYAGKGGTDAQGTWYLPAKSELQYLWCAYNGKAPISWSTGTNTSAPTDATVQTAFNKYLTDAGGTGITSNYLWSSTEYSNGTSSAWYVGFTSGNTSYTGRVNSHHVRCVKQSTPAIGDFRDDGIVYWVDGANYKVVSLSQTGSLKWSGENYLLGAQGQSNTDGKANVAAMKAYSTRHTNDLDNTTKTTGVFATDFPAAADCDAKNTGGVTGWYLPAKDEMLELCTAYSANKAVLDNAISAHNGTTMANTFFWSSTEYSSNIAWIFHHVENKMSNTEKYDTEDLYVRCIRSN